MADTYYAWDPEFDCITKETDADGVVTARYTQEPRPFGGLISQYRSGVSSFYHYDAIGTARALTDSIQSITDTSVYSAFGEKVASTGSTMNPFGFVGQLGYYSTPISKAYVRARNYDTSIVRWLSTDPLFPMKVLGPYVAMMNRVTLLVDPSGERTIEFYANAYIGNKNAAGQTRPGAPWFPEPCQIYRYFQGDDRSAFEVGTSRIEQKGSIESCIPYFHPKAGQVVGKSHFKDCSYSYFPCPGLICGQIQERQAKFDTDIVNRSSFTDRCGAWVTIRGSAGYPGGRCLGWFPVDTPNIDIITFWSFKAKGPNKIHVELTIEHDPFPDYEAAVDGKHLYSYLSPYNGPGLGNLWVYQRIKATKSIDIEANTPCISCKGTCAESIPVIIRFG